MPFSRLVNAAYATTTTVVRPCSSGGSRGLCSHGLITGQSSNLKGSTRANYLRTSSGSFAHAHSAFSHLASRCDTLFTQSTRAPSSLHKTPTPTTPRARPICSHRNFALDLEKLFHGNQEYVARMSKDHPGFLAKSANEPQSTTVPKVYELSSLIFFPDIEPSLMILDCADSR